MRSPTRPLRYPLVFALVLTLGCGGGSDAGPAGPEEWTVDGPRVSIGTVDGAEEDQFVSVAAAWVNGAGEILVLDFGKSVLEVFDAAGAHVRTIGRRGRGPGEFARAAVAWPYRGDSIAVYDVVARRLSVFDPAGTFGRSFDSPLRWVRRPGVIPSQSCCVIRGSFADGSFAGYLPEDVPVEPGPPRYSLLTLLRLSPDGVVTDTLGRIESTLYAYDADAPNHVRSHEGSYPFRYAVVGDTLYGGNGLSAALMAFDRTGATRDVALAGEPAPFDDALRTAREEAIRADYELRGSSYYEGAVEGYLPGHWAPVVPRFVHLFADAAGRIWLERWSPRYGLAGATSVYDIVEPSGDPVATITLPPGARPLWADDRTVLLLEQDSLDVDYVRLYDLSQAGGTPAGRSGSGTAAPF